jgi:hypothetical protein
MSNSSLPDHRTALPEPTRVSLLHELARRLRGLAFWSAIALPFLHIPLLVTGLGDSTTLLAFLALVAVNVVALVLGQPHAAE